MSDNMSIRVLHLIKTSVGAYWAALQIRELVKLGVDVHAALPPGGKLLSLYHDFGATVHLRNFDFPVGRPWLLPGLFKQIRALVDEIRPDIIHSHFVGTTLLTRLALGQEHPIPRIFQVPGPLHLEHPLFRRLDVGLAGPRDYWIGTCRWTCERYLKSGIPKDRVFLSYYGTDISMFKPGEKMDLRRELNLADDAEIVGMVAYMYRPRRYLGYRRGIKGHEYLIDALTICIKQDPKIVGVFVGGAWANAIRYERRVHRYGWSRCGEKAIFMGTHNDVPQIMPNFDVVAVPSLTENLGGALEPLLMEIPTVATSVGGLPELIIHGETGFLVPPRNPERLASAIIEMLSDRPRAEEMARRGRMLASELLDIERTGRQVFGIYQKVLS